MRPYELDPASSRRRAELGTISTVAQSNLIAEIAERLTELQLGARSARRLAIVLPLKQGAREKVRALLEAGPPFDPSALQGLDRYEVFLTANEVVFLFESGLGTDALAALLSRAEIRQAASAWHEHLEGPPRIAEDVYSWARVERDGDAYYLPTPGPGDSDGGDVY
jgi:hypothetical protein